MRKEIVEYLIELELFFSSAIVGYVFSNWQAPFFGLLAIVLFHIGNENMWEITPMKPNSRSKKVIVALSLILIAMGIIGFTIDLIAFKGTIAVLLKTLVHTFFMVYGLEALYKNTAQ